MLVLNLQFWENDKAQAMALARLMADLEPVKRDDVVFLFTARFDCAHDEETVSYVAQKFRVIKYTTKRKATGWPNGPNQMMGCSYEFCVEQYRFGKLPGIKGVMFMEADCVPLHKYWISMLIKEYDQSGMQIMGAWLKRGDCGVEHINGNCIIGINFWRRNKSIFHPDEKGGWDATLAHILLPNGHPSRLIWSDYQLGQPHNPWRGCDYLWQAKRYQDPQNALYGQDVHPVFLHGVKIMSGIECARKRLLNEPQS